VFLASCLVTSALAASPGTDQNLAEVAAEHVAQGRLLEGIEVQRVLTTEHPEDIEAWRQLATWAGWASLPDLRLEALQRQAGLVDPLPPDLARDLGQALAWGGHPAEAAPYLDVALEAGDPSLLPLWTWAQTEAGQEDRARDHLIALERQGSLDVDLRMALASLTHWSRRWGVARRQYAAILDEDPAHPEATRRRRELRKAHGPLVRASGKVVVDSNDVERFESTVAIDAAPTPALRVGARAGVDRIAERQRATGPTSTRRDVAEGLLTLRPPGPVWLETQAGAERFDLDGNGRPIATARLRSAWLDRYYPTLTYTTRTYATALAPVEAGIRTHDLSASVWARPLDTLEVGSSLLVGFLSDGNRRTESYTAVTWAPKLEPLVVRPQLAATTIDTARIYADALPYFTQDRTVVLAPGAVAGVTTKGFALTVGYSAAWAPWQQTLAHAPQARLRVTEDRIGNLEGWVERRATPAYAYVAGYLGWSRRF